MVLGPLVRLAHLMFTRRLAAHVVTERDDVAYVVSVGDDGPGRALTIFGTTPEFDVMPRALSILHSNGTPTDGTVLVDVGANIGTTSLPAVQQHGFGRSIAIEPERENVRALRASVALNELEDRIDVVVAAAGAEPGTAPFRRGKRTRNGWRAGAGRLGVEGEDVETVPVVTVDGELASRNVRPDRVGMLWIDVQGHEGHVLAGAPGLVRRACPVVFAVRPRKLARAGSLALLIELIRSRYAYVVDLRHGDCVPRPADRVEAVIGSTTTSDILAFGRRS